MHDLTPQDGGGGGAAAGGGIVVIGAVMVWGAGPIVIDVLTSHTTGHQLWDTQSLASQDTEHSSSPLCGPCFCTNIL